MEIRVILVHEYWNSVRYYEYCAAVVYETGFFFFGHMSIDFSPPPPELTNESACDSGMIL